MAEILLTSETFVKSVTAISDNIAGKHIQPQLAFARKNGIELKFGDYTYGIRFRKIRKI
mgnify:CR=1 FL=1